MLIKLLNAKIILLGKANIYLGSVFGWEKNDFFRKWFFDFSLFGTIKDGKIFSKENDCYPNWGKWFPFWKNKKLIFLFNSLMIWSVEI